FLEIDPPRKIVQTWKPDWDGGHVTTITYRLDAIANGTRVTVRHAGFGERVESCKNHGLGWERVLGWLGAHAGKPMFFLSRLLPPRPSFMLDMSEAERKLMQEHAAYYRTLATRRVAIAYGPVMDPKGGWGVGIMRARDQAEIDGLLNQDPTIRSGLGFRYETFVMPAVVVGERD